jgi:hypothetical protein
VDILVNPMSENFGTHHDEAATADFVAAARVLAAAARRLGLVAPGFRSPPRIVGVHRTLRRFSGGGGGIVSVVVRGRPFVAVLADMIEGIVAVNDMPPPHADRARAALWAVVDPGVVHARVA